MITRDQIRAAYDTEIPNRYGLTTVPISDIWGHVKTSGDQNQIFELHRILKDMTKDRTIELVMHSRTEPIPDEIQRLTIKGRYGETLYYVRFLN